MRSNRIGGAIFKIYLHFEFNFNGALHLKKLKEMIYYSLIQNFRITIIYKRSTA